MRPIFAGLLVLLFYAQASLSQSCSTCDSPNLYSSSFKNDMSYAEYSWGQATALFSRAHPVTKQELNPEQIFVGRCAKNSYQVETQAGLVVLNAKKRVFFDFKHSNPDHWLTMSDVNLSHAAGEIRKTRTFQRMKDISEDIGFHFYNADNKDRFRIRKTVENGHDIFVVELAREITWDYPAFYPYQICWLEARL